MEPGGSGSRRTFVRVAASVAVISLTAGFLAAAWVQARDEGPTTYAGLFGPPVLDLRLIGEHGVNGFVGGRNLAPGDRVSGTLRLSTALPAPGGAFDLDFDVQWKSPAPANAQRFEDALVVTRLAYGSDDLLTAPSRDLLKEIDGNPLLGDGNGRLTLRELGAGANDLPPPGLSGTPYTIELKFDPVGNDPDAWAGKQLTTTFVFRIGDVADADLN